jgi:hypothetical protein
MGCRLRLTSRVADRLRNLRRLRDASDSGRLNNLLAPRRLGWTHALIRGLASFRSVGFAASPPQSQRAVRSFYVRGASFRIPPSGRFLVRALHGRRENLLTLKGLFKSSRETASSRICLASRFPALLPGMGALFVAHLPQPRGCVPEIVVREFLNLRMMGNADGFIFVETQQASLKTAGSRHGFILFADAPGQPAG